MLNIDNIECIIISIIKYNFMIYFLEFFKINFK